MKPFLFLLFILFTPPVTADNMINAEPDLQALLEKLEASRQQRDIPAIGLTIVDGDGIIWTGALGIADRNSQTSANADTYFRIGSITKTFTAMAIHRLVEDGLLELDDSLASVAPKLTIHNPWHATHPVRIRHLLEHTAGLTDLTAEEFNNQKPRTLTAALAVAPDARQVHWPPGLYHSYTNAGAGLLSYVIEKQSGMKYEDYVEQHLFKSLGMDSATYFQNAAVKETLATGYNTDGYKTIPYWHMLFRAFGAINLNVADMAPPLRMLLNAGKYNGKSVLTPESVTTMETPSSTLAAKQGLKFGYGAGLYQYTRKGYRFYGHGGDADGYLSRFGYNRESGMGYYVVINVFRGDDLRHIRQLVEDYILRDLPTATKPAAKLAQSIIDNYSGNYDSITWRFDWGATQAGKRKLKIIHADGALFYQAKDGRRKQLVPVTDNTFRFAKESIATVAFVKDEAGHRYLEVDGTSYTKSADQ